MGAQGCERATGHRGFRRDDDIGATRGRLETAVNVSPPRAGPTQYVSRGIRRRTARPSCVELCALRSRPPRRIGWRLRAPVTTSRVARSVHMMLLLVMLSGAAMFGGWGMPSSAGADRAPQRAKLDAARARWAAQHIRDYRFRLRVDCFCPDSRRASTITVRDGRAHGGAGFQKHFDTVPEMFKEIRKALDDPDAGATVVRYDARRGFPRSARIDPIRMAIDDERGWTADRFRVLARTR